MFINKILFRFAKLSYKSIIVIIAFQTVIALITSATSLITGQLISDFLSPADPIKSSITQKILMLIALMVIIALMGMYKGKLAIKAGIEVKNNVRSMLIQKLFLLGPCYLKDNRTGTLTSIMTSRVEWLMNYYVLYLPTVTSAIINAFVFIAFLIYVDIVTGLIGVISCIAMIIIPMLFFRIMRNRGVKEWEMHAEYYSNCLDGIQGMVSLKALCADKRYVSKTRLLGDSLRISVMNHLKITMLEGAFSEFFARVGGALTLAVLAIRLSVEKVDPGMAVLAFFATGAAFVPMLSLINAWHMGFQGVSAAFSIDEMLKESETSNLAGSIISKTLLPFKHLSKEMKEWSGTLYNNDRSVIEFKNVNFYYDANEKFKLQDISFKIGPDQMIALVGKSGSGKSTIANLLSGFYQPDKGTITLNGRSLASNNIDYYRSLISAIWQDSHLFNGSIYENILIGNKDATLEDVENATKLAGIYEFISKLPDGFKTEIGENGKLLSTGERQRIAMARAFLKNSSILIFDEATSSLDRDNEIQIQERFKRLRCGKTVLVIAHRLQTIIDADEICVLEKGIIVERGSHSDLLEKSTVYRKIMGEQLNEG